MTEILPFAPPTRRTSSIRRTERRSWQRVALCLPLIFLSDNREEAKGETINLSGGGLLFRTESPPYRGDRIVCYVEQLGRISGHVVRSTSGFVSVASDAPFTKRDRLVDQLTWVVNKRIYGLTEERRSSRQQGDSTLVVYAADGRELRCMVMDMSFVGVALATSDPKPLVGERVQVGSQQGRVARYLPEGFAVDFTRI